MMKGDPLVCIGVSIGLSIVILAIFTSIIWLVIPGFSIVIVCWIKGHLINVEEGKKERARLAADKQARQAVEAQARANQQAELQERQYDQDRIAKLRKIVKVSNSLEISRLAEVLHINEKMLWDRIFDWAEQFGFRIEENKVIFGQGNVAGFVDELDKHFATWGSKESTKEGKGSGSWDIQSDFSQ